MKAFIASILAFFSTLFASPQAPVPSPMPTPMATPWPSPSYLRQDFINQELNYQLSIPADTDIQTSPDGQTSWDDIYTLKIDPYLQDSVDMDTILVTDLYCNADGPNQSTICRNTAVKPFTNASGSPGFLIRRTINIDGLNSKEIKDTAYVFPITSSASNAVILSVSDATEANLNILTDVANWFVANP